MLICVQCNKEFIKKHSRQKLCSEECRKIFRQEYLKKYNQSDKRKEYAKKHSQLDSTKEYLREYRRKERNIKLNKAYPKIKKGQIITRKEAKANGLKKYFTGKPCQRGHISERTFPNGDCLKCMPVQQKNYYATESGKAKVNAANTKYSTSLKGKIKRRKLYKKYYHEDMKDINLRVSHNLESAFKSYFKIKGIDGKRKNKIKKLVGLKRNDFMKYMEKQFSKKMSWDNYGTVWHIDHIIPKSFFDFTDERQLRVCWHHTNLRPMLAGDNLRKHAKFSGIEIYKIMKNLDKALIKTTKKKKKLVKRIYKLKQKLKLKMN